MSGAAIRLLLAEDDPVDVELELREMRRAGMSVSHQVADTAEAFVRGLREFAPDAILSDFSMPMFDGMEALRLANEFAPWTPFLFVSGTLGEEYAIRALKSGATDYVLKTNLVRLPAAIDRAIASAKERRARRNAEAGLARAQAMAKLGHVITGADGTFESWSDSLPALIGIKTAAMPVTTRQWLEIVHPDDRAALRAVSREALATKGRMETDYRLRGGSGEWIHVRQVLEPLSSEGNAQEKWFNTLQDVTDQKHAENQIRRLNRVHTVLSGINSLIARAASREELFAEACRIAVRDGHFPLAWIGLLDKAGTRLEVAAYAGDGEGYVDKMPLVVGAGNPAEGIAGTAVRTKKTHIANDIARDERISIRSEALSRGFRSLVMLPLIVRGESLGVLAFYTDQAGFFDSQEMKLLNELAGDIAFAVDHIDQARKLEYLSYFDPLTGLANRTVLMDRLAQSIASTGGKAKLALVLLDIERFKTINDTLGRREGDALLAALAGRLVELAGDPGRVAHLGADRFAVIIPDVHREERIAHAIDAGFAKVEGEPFQLSGAELRVAIRSGIAIYPNDCTDADSLFRNAEAAMKKAKAGGDKYLFYTQQMTERVAGRLSLENKLRQAVEKEEFVLHYQPKVDLERRIVGAEALIRWRSPEGLVPPVKFIPLLEETGLIVPVGNWALKQAALDHGAWAARGLKPPRVAVNVSSVQLRRRDFVEAVQQAIGTASPPPLDLEITESLAMEDIEVNILKLTTLRELGVGIAIDDFGTGYSSLGYLAKLPVQSLKIDRSFIITMEADANAMTLVATIVSLAHSLKLEVIAEGVETEAQAARLRELRCDQMQGYLFSRPVPAEAFAKLLEA